MKSFKKSLYAILAATVIFSLAACEVSVDDGDDAGKTTYASDPYDYTVDVSVSTSVSVPEYIVSTFDSEQYSDVTEIYATESDIQFESTSEEVPVTDENGAYFGTKETGNYVYTGWMIDGVPSGHGTMSFIDGSYFEGIFEDGVRTEGKYCFTNGDVFEGTFVDNYMHIGTYTYSNGVIIYGRYERTLGSFVPVEETLEESVDTIAPIETEVSEVSEAVITEAPEPVRVAPTYEFSTDLSAYEEYMNPADIDAYLVLANPANPLGASYVPTDLVPITDVRKDGRNEVMNAVAEKALQALYIEMRAAGYTDVSVTSGYRSYEKQSTLYNRYVTKEMNKGYTREEAEKIVDKYSAHPGTSDHQTGLCCDMHNLSSSDVKFAEKAAFKWLEQNCYKFGFIIRFPKDKEHITGYTFEPGHFRFVGRYHASEMHRLGLCLEEYIEYLND